MSEDIKRRFSLLWQTMGHDEVQAQADRVDEALDAVAQQVDEVTRHTTSGKKALGAYGDEMEDARRRAERAGDAIDEMGRSAQRAEGGAKGLDGGLQGVNERVKTGLQGFDEMQGRLGQFTNALNLLSGVAIVGMITGIRDSVTALYEYTEAGQAAKVADEARTTAISGVVDWLKQQKTITEQTTAATWAKINADRAQAVSSERLSKVITESYDVQTEYAKVLRELAILKEKNIGLDGFSERSGTGVKGAQTLLTERAERLRTKLVELNDEREREQARLVAINQLVDDASKTLDKSATSFDESTAAVVRSEAAIDAATQSWMELGRVMQETGNLYLQYGQEVISLESFAPSGPIADFDFAALGQLVAGGLNEGLSQVQRIGDALGIGAARDDLALLFETIGEHAAGARSVLGDVSSTVGIIGQIGSLESQNAIQRAKNRERDAKGEKERLAAQKVLLAAEKAAEQERRRMQALDFALKAADNAGAAIEETAKAAGAYPDPVGMALHGFAALKHGVAAAFYGKGVAASLSAPSAVSGGAGGGPGTPSAPTAADRPVDNGDQRGGGTTIVLNGILADGRAVRTATTDALNTVGDGQIPIDTDGGF